MGCKNSAAYFQNTKKRVLKSLLYRNVLVYIDDVLLFGENISDLLAAIRELFQRLRAHRIFLKPAKCETFAPRVLWCGHLIDAEGIAVNPVFILAVAEIAIADNAATRRQILASAY